MADRKITELANITGANLADADEFVVVDASADETKGITFAELKSGLDTATGFVRITGDTMTGDLNGTNVTLSGYLRGPSSFTIDPAAHGDNTGTVVVAGNLQVDGTTTTINSTALDVDDLNITVASGAANAAAANGAGLTVDGASATFTYASTGDKWTMNKPLDVTGNIIVSGTVDGRDVAADGTKLDTVATSATANPNAIDNVVEDTTPQLGGDLASNGNDILFADNDKAIFGAGSDLQIYHDGSNSYIKDNGTGDFILQAYDDFKFQQATDNADLLTINTGGNITVHNGNVDVTGDVISDGLTVAGNVSVDGGTIKLDGNYPVGTGNVALGDAAMNGSISGNYNTALGDYSMQPMTSGASNTGVGGSALRFVTSGSYNTAVGHQSLHANTTASENTAVGYQSLYSNVTGTENSALGRGALYNNLSSYNTSVGRNSMYNNTTGNRNVALGVQALLSNTTATNNTAVGYQAGYSNTTGSYQTVFGYQAGYSNTAALGSNTFVGWQAGYNSTGDGNTFVGARYITSGTGSGSAMTTGSKNTILGAYSGNQGGLDIRTSSNNIVLSDGDGNPRAYYHGGLSSPSWFFETPTLNQWAMQIHHTTTSANTAYGLNIKFTDISPNDTTRKFLDAADSVGIKLTIYSNGNVVNVNNSYGAISDIKLKENIVDAASQWNDIKALTVRKYSMKADNLDAPNMLGVIAQEVEEAGMGGLVFESPDIDPETKEDLGTVTKQVNYSILYMKAVKALQEAMDRIETLEAKVTALENV